jgi:hypothetical protein
LKGRGSTPRSRQAKLRPLGIPGIVEGCEQSPAR